MLAFLYTSCMFLVLVILVIGVTLVNNYDRMASMENALHQISESLGEEEISAEDTPSIEEGMEAENRLAAAKEPETPAEEPKTEEPGEEAPQEEQPQEEPEEVKEEQPPQDAAPEEQPPQENTEETAEAVSQAVQEPERYQVQVGDTLLEISRVRYGTDEMVKKICEINDLEDGDKIYVGETILLP